MRKKNNEIKLDVLIVGAGFGGMYMLHKLRELGLEALIVEAGDGVGGTWYWNRYPGARCDVESIEYSYSFSEELQQEWSWSSRYSTQDEILKYANHVADRFDLRKDIKFNQRVISSVFKEDLNKWNISTSSGDNYLAQYCIMATGTLSSVKEISFNGLDSYKGDWYVTGNWPHQKIDFTGKKVGIIGTGSSAVQAIPVIAEDSEHLTVFQRTANYSIPAKNKKLTNQEVKKVKSNYASIRDEAKNARAGIASTVYGTKNVFDVSDEERNREFQKKWDYGGTDFNSAFMDIGFDERANDEAANFVRSKIKEIVKDPETAELLSPKTTIACKRLCADTDYFETYNKSNVDLIDINKTPIESLTTNGLKTSKDQFSFDIIIFATGFDAMTGALTSIDIIGKNGVNLADKWKEGPKSYLGLCIEGFPNMFTITGPGSPSVLGNMMVAIEQHVEWIIDCIKHMNANDKKEIEAELTAENEWMDLVEIIASSTLRDTCNSWYVGANVPGKKRVFMPYAGGYQTYREKCDEIAKTNYEGFKIS